MSYAMMKVLVCEQQNYAEWGNWQKRYEKSDVRSQMSEFRSQM